MIVTEDYMTRKDGVKILKRYSDKNVMIHKVNTDEYYDIALDVENAPWTYEETDNPIEGDTNDL